MKHTFALFIIFASVLWCSIASSDAQQNTDCTTLHANSTDHGTIDFINPSTDFVVHQDDVPYQFMIDHSPDCRWLIGYATRYFAVLDDAENCEPGVIIWDALTGIRLQEFDSMCDTSLSGYPRFIWKPDNTALIISRWQDFPTTGSTAPRVLWYPNNNQLINLADIQYKRVNLINVLWDDARQLIWSSGNAGVGALSMSTGELIYWFPNTPTKSRFILSPDFSKIVAYGHHRDRGYNDARMSIHNISSGESVTLNIETNGLGTVAMSPDNRYVGMAYTAIRIWDLQNLSEDHLPSYRFYFPDSDIADWSFIDNTIIEATSEAGDVMRWSLVTGQPIDISP